MRSLLRTGARAGVVTAVIASSMLITSPVFALERDDGDDPGEPISTLKTLLYFVVGPIAALVLIWVLVSLPSITKGPRYRPGQEWQGAPEWYGAPGAETPEVSSGYGAAPVPARPADAALTGTIVSGPGEVGPDGDERGDGGGTSARW